MKYKWATSLGDFEESPEKIWGVEPYDPDGTDDCVFCGLYGLPDFYALWQYKGKKYVWWCGTDITHFINGYWLEDGGGIKLDPKPLAEWINKNCENWVENEVEARKLAEHGITNVKIVSSFLGDVSKFTPQEIRTDKERYYTSVSGNDFELYGWDKVSAIALKNPQNEYHFYGNTIPSPYPCSENCIFHGRVSKEQMNEECRTMTGAIRMVEFEGCSEIIIKSVLWGQKPVSLIEYPFLRAKSPREELLKVLSRYPWNAK